MSACRFAGPAADSSLLLASSDEEEPLAAGLPSGSIRSTTLGASPSVAGDTTGQESAEEEGAYHFRRSKSSQYHKVCAAGVRVCAQVHRFVMLSFVYTFCAATGQQGRQLAVGITRGERHSRSEVPVHVDIPATRTVSSSLL